MDPVPTIFYSIFPDAQPRPRTFVVDDWTRLATYNAGRKSERTILIRDVSGALPVAVQADDIQIHGVA